MCVSLMCCIDVISRLSVHKPSRVGEQMHLFAERRTRIVVRILQPQSLQFASFLCVGAEILLFSEDQRLHNSERTPILTFAFHVFDVELSPSHK